MLARSFLLLTLAGMSAGCGSSDPSSEAPQTWVASVEVAAEGERYLSVQWDGRYEVAVEVERRAVQGKLSPTQTAELQALGSKAQFDVYLQESLPECRLEDESATVHHVLWRERTEPGAHYSNGCWVRADVERQETRAFLDSLIALQRELAD